MIFYFNSFFKYILNNRFYFAKFSIKDEGVKM